jgi:hypothetical protein
MSLIEKIRNKPEKTRNMIVAGISGFFVLIIILIGLIWYEAPYKRYVRREYTLTRLEYFKNFFSSAEKDADQFVDPIDDLFTQQNTDLSSQN